MTGASFSHLDTSGLDPARAHQPLLLLDIDGVVNAYAYRPGTTALPNDAFTDLQEFPVLTDGGQSFRFWVSPMLVASLLVLAEQVEVAWLTTWQDQANSRVAPALGLPAFPVAARDCAALGRWDSDWKVQAALEALQLGRPLIWADDTEIGPRARRVFAASGVQHQLIVPHPRVGLTRADLEAMSRFAAAHQG